MPETDDGCRHSPKPRIQKFLFLRIERAGRFVEERVAGAVSRSRAKASRCRSPAESTSTHRNSASSPPNRAGRSARLTYLSKFKGFSGAADQPCGSGVR
jgi:hypothetical protein